MYRPAAATVPGGCCRWSPVSACGQVHSRHGAFAFPYGRLTLARERRRLRVVEDGGRRVQRVTLPPGGRQPALTMYRLTRVGSPRETCPRHLGVAARVPRYELLRLAAPFRTAGRAVRPDLARSVACPPLPAACWSASKSVRGIESPGSRLRSRWPDDTTGAPPPTLSADASRASRPVAARLRVVACSTCADGSQELSTVGWRPTRGG